MARFVLRPCLAALAALLLGACSVNPGLRTVDTPDAALVFGYYDMADSPNTLRSVFLTQNEKSGIAYRQSRMRTFTDGLYFQESLPPMKYHLPFFVAGNVTHLVSSDEKDLFEVPAGAMVFLGAYKFHDPNKGGIFSPNEFELRPVKKPSEREVLQMVLERIEDERWKQRIRKRLRQLKR